MARFNKMGFDIFVNGRLQNDNDRANKIAEAIAQQCINDEIKDGETESISVSDGTSLNPVQVMRDGNLIIVTT